MTKHIFWIASYPKSGNTLMRSVLAALFFSHDGKFEFDLLKKIVTLEEVARLRKVKELNPNNFLNKNLKERSSLIFDNLNELQKKSNLGFKEDFAFFKTHFSAKNFDNKKFLIDKYVRGIIYIVRDPRDVCISWSKYANLTISESLNFLIDEEAFIQWTAAQGAIEYPQNIPVIVSSWENHFLSWKNSVSELPHLIIKYEDLVYDKERVILKILEFFKINYNIRVQNEYIKINNILKTTNFEKMQEEEKNKGFEETNVNQFFSIGQKEQWKNKLSYNDILMIEKNFRKTMRDLNYQLNIEI